MNAIKKGLIHPSLISLIFTIIMILVLLPWRANLHAAFNKAALHFGINLNNIASDNYVAWIKNQPQDFHKDNLAIFLNKDLANPQTLADADILGEQTLASGEKWIEVDLSDQRLYMKEGDKIVNSFLVSTGKWYPTPTGEWRIWTKLRYTRMKGGSKALGTFYDLPNVPYTMYYYKGYGIHGAYWHNNFGQPMSHGCVNVRPEEAGVVFNWASVGTRVQVHQ